jgi:hypothetical protein
LGTGVLAQFSARRSCDGYCGFAVPRLDPRIRWRAPQETNIEPTAVLCFDHPYAAVAIAGRLTRPEPSGPTGPLAAFTGVPLFSPWVPKPEQTQKES